MDERRQSHGHRKSHEHRKIHEHRCRDTEVLVPEKYGETPTVASNEFRTP